MQKTRILCLFLSLVLLTVPVCAAPCRMQTRNGSVCWYENGDASHDTGVPADALPHDGDRALLRCGLAFPDRAGLTRALEDYCS